MKRKLELERPSIWCEIEVIVSLANARAANGSAPSARAPPCARCGATRTSAPSMVPTTTSKASAHICWPREPAMTLMASVWRYRFVQKSKVSHNSDFNRQSVISLTSSQRSLSLKIPISVSQLLF